MDLNKLFAVTSMNSDAWPWKKDCCVTQGSANVLSNFDDADWQSHSCLESLEEADNRIVLHIKNMINKSMTSFLIRTADSDVIVILFSFMTEFLQCNETIKIWVDFGTGDHQRYISIHDAYKNLGETISLALPFFHTFTGCDSTCSFYGISKTMWFQRWMECPNQIW